jgi:hypothetical protein
MDLNGPVAFKVSGWREEAVREWVATRSSASRPTPSQIAKTSMGDIIALAAEIEREREARDNCTAALCPVCEPSPE